MVIEHLTEPSLQGDRIDNDNPKLQEEIRLLLDVIDLNEKRNGVLNNHANKEKDSVNVKTGRGKYTHL